MSVDASLPVSVGPLPPPLLGLFRALLRAGVRLGVRDYLDALRALEAGFGGPTRADLARLAEALWARNPEELRLVRRWFADVPPPPAALQAPIEQAWQRHDAAQAGSAAAPDSSDMRARDATRAAGTSGDAAGGGAGAAAGPQGGAGPSAGSRARIALEAGHEAGGLALPRVIAEPLLADEYVLEPHALVPLRQLAVLWRRHRRATRSGPRTELDLAATVRARCELGLLGAPVLRPRRRNAARLLVLADASPSMTPWLPFLQTLEQSLAFGRLGQATLRWFGNVPRRQLHASPRLDAPESCDDWLARHAGAGVLVVSDAGSVRGLLNRRRWLHSREFVDRAAATCGRIVWLNPMPRPRWEGSTAALLADDPRVAMLALDATNLLRAVDLLRGLK